MFSFAFGFSILTVLVWLWPRPGDVVAVLAMPGAGPQHMFDMIARADGRIIDIDRIGSLALARSDSPAFVGQLYAAGALFVFHPRVLTGCGLKFLEHAGT